MFFPYAIAYVMKRFDISHLIKQSHLHKAGQCVEFKLALAHTDGQIWKIQFNMSGEKNVIVFYFT